MPRTRSSVKKKKQTTGTSKVSEPLILQCSICDCKFKCAVNFNSHKQYHSGSAVDLLTCAECGKKLSDKRVLERHLRRFHFSKLFEAEAYRCDMCDRSFSDKCNLDRHIRNMHESSVESRTKACKFCKKHYAKSSFHHHEKVCRKGDNFTDFRCSKCDRSFSRKEVLEKHVRRQHSETSSFKCEICFKSFLRKPYLEAHVSIQHPEGTTTYTCAICKQVFTDEKLYFDHLKSGDHYKRRCPKCSRDFTDREQYFDHQIYCIKAGKSTCRFCGRPMTKQKLQTHVRTFHKEEMSRTENESYICASENEENSHETTRNSEENIESNEFCEEATRPDYAISTLEPDIAVPMPDTAISTPETVESTSDCVMSNMATTVSVPDTSMSTAETVIPAQDCATSTMETAVSVPEPVGALPDIDMSTPETVMPAKDCAMSTMENVVSVPKTAESTSDNAMSSMETTVSVSENQESIESSQNFVSTSSEMTETPLKSEPPVCTQHVTERTQGLTLPVCARAQVPAAPVYHNSEDTARRGNNSADFQNAGSGTTSMYNIIEIKPIIEMKCENI